MRLVSSGSSGARSSASSGGAASARMSAWRRARSVFGLGELAVVVLIGVGRVGGREDDLQLARVLAPGGEKAVARQGDGGVVLATRRLHGVVERRGDLLPEGGRRVQEVQVDVAMRGDRAENLQPGGRQAREAQDREAVREVGELRLVPEALAGGGEALGRARDLEVRTQPTPQLRLPAGVVGQAGVVPRGPPPPASPAGAARSGRRALRCAAPRRAAPGSARGVRGGRRARARRGARRPPPAAATPHDRDAHGSSSGSMPDAAASALSMTRRGDGNATLAQIPSWRSVVAPRWSDSRCAIHRSTPLDGTATTSAANGSAGGVARVSRRASTRASVRVARWRWSIGLREACPISRGRPGGALPDARMLPSYERRSGVGGPYATTRPPGSLNSQHLGTSLVPRLRFPGVSKRRKPLHERLSRVAGAGFEPATFGL